MHTSLFALLPLLSGVLATQTYEYKAPEAAKETAAASYEWDSKDAYDSKSYQANAYDESTHDVESAGAEEWTSSAAWEEHAASTAEAKEVSQR